MDEVVRMVLAVGLVLLYLGVFIWALVDSIRNPQLTGKIKLLWILFILFAGIGCMVYIFLRPKKSASV